MLPLLASMAELPLSVLLHLKTWEGKLPASQEGQDGPCALRETLTGRALTVYNLSRAGSPPDTWAEAFIQRRSG